MRRDVEVQFSTGLVFDQGRVMIYNIQHLTDCHLPLSSWTFRSKWQRWKCHELRTLANKAKNFPRFPLIGSCKACATLLMRTLFSLADVVGLLRHMSRADGMVMPISYYSAREMMEKECIR